MSGRAARAAGGAGRVAVGLAGPTVAYYALRRAGVGTYLALLASALLSAVPALVSLVRRREVDGLTGGVALLTLGALAVSLVPGGTRFLLARDAVMTGATGLWFLLSARGRRPLVLLLSRPLLQGRLGWPADWDALWALSPRFRRMWRVAGVLWGLGLLADAGLRVLAAYALPPDVVPALGLALYAVTVVLLNVVTHVWFAACGVHDPHSAMRRAGTDESYPQGRSAPA